MSASKYPYGLWVAGPCSEGRVIVPAADAFRSYCLADSTVKVESEAYLSAFQFGNDMRDRVEGTGTPRGFDGPTWASYLWFDIDRSPDQGGVAQALADTRRLVACLGSDMGAPQECLLSFFSGSKGFHVGVPTALWAPEPGPMFHDTAKMLAQTVAAKAGVPIDAGVYDRVRLFRAPNSRHPKTGLHKVRLAPGQLGELDDSTIAEIAAAPVPFEPQSHGDVRVCPAFAAAWESAAASAARSAVTQIQRKRDQAAGSSPPSLNDMTLSVIRGEPVEPGQRHKCFYSAAANLGEFGCTQQLAEALLMESGRSSGLTRAEIARQIRCGLAAGNPLVKGAMEKFGARITDVTDQEGPWDR